MRISVWSSDVCASDLEACSVDAGSLRWSPSGRQLYFSARYRQGDGFDHRHYIYDAKSGAVVPFQMAGVPFEIEVERARFLAPLLWLDRSEEHTSELQSLMRTSYAVFCLKKKTTKQNTD